MEIIVLTNDRPELTLIALQSVACQTIKPSRLIVMDDGLTSAMASPAFRKMMDYLSHKGWETEYRRNHEHKGVTYVRWKAAKLVESDHVLMLDGDIMLPRADTLDSLLKAIKLPTRHNFAVPRLVNVDNEHGAWHDPFARGTGEITGDEPHAQWRVPPEDEDSGHAQGIKYGATACILYRASALKAAGAFDFWEEINEGEEVLMSDLLGNKGLLLQDHVAYHFGNQWTKEGLMQRLDDTKRKLVRAIQK